ncbi:MAG: AAA family ATPase [Candidatus Aminicenantes bacterium]|nr:AAA family ATPase [Candidatus Aminicenantes bacterium]
MNEEKTKRIPYGISDYELIRAENYYYVDKTPYLETLEKTGRYVFFIRPRRFGKTLFLSMMETYYDIQKKDKFDFFYGGTAIHANPTAEKNTYLVLKFNFSLISPQPDSVEDSFFSYILDTADFFMSKYSQLLNVDAEEKIKELKTRKTASDILSSLISLCRKNKQKLYVIIDEYDNFANTILSSSGSRDYKKITHGEGFFRTFFNVLKGGTSGSGAPISRLFVTGVSPITLDDVTSGFNIGENISIDAPFNRMAGFTGADVEAMLEYYKSAGKIKHDTSFLLNIMNNWYGNYLFSIHDKTRMYNSDMVLYFLKQYFKTQAVPDELIDRNVKIDYGKIRHLVIINKTKGKTVNGNFDRLKQVVEKGEVLSNLEKGFSIENLADTGNFISLLFYFGLLTIDGVERDKIRFRIPNETVKRLFYDYIMEGYKETGVFSLNLAKYGDLMSGMAYDGRWEPLFDYIASLMSESMSLRDLIVGEKSIQAFLNVYLGLSDLYIIHAEKEMNKGYADIVMEPFLAGYEGIKYSYIIEIKYKKRGDRGRKDSQSSSLPLPGTSTGDAFDVLFKKKILKEPAAGEAGPDSKPRADGIDKKKVQQLVEEAEEQLKKYSIDKKFRKSIGKTELVKLVLVFSGHEAVYIGPVK